MSIFKEYLESKRKIESAIIEYIDEDSKGETEKFQNFTQLYDTQKYSNNTNEFKLLLQLISIISQNHKQQSRIFGKIKQILLYIKEDIKKNFADNEILSFFILNKRIFLFLIEEKIINFDIGLKKAIKPRIFNQFKYYDYLLNECKPFTGEEYYRQELENLPENYEEKRKIGENESELCELIRNDSLNDFISYLSQNNIDISMTIKPSICETNYLLIILPPTLIEYAAFFGSIQIFKYLHKNDAPLNPQIWIYAIHGGNAELIHIIEENNFDLDVSFYESMFEEALKCHNNEIANYILNNFLNDTKKNFYSSYNFEFIQDDLIKKSDLSEFCIYDYYYFAETLLKTEDIDINEPGFFQKDDLNRDTGYNPLQLALMYQNYDIVELLLSSKNVNPNLKLYIL